MPDLPSGTLTFFFSDIEGSTRLLQRLGDRYPEILGEHGRIIRDAIADYAGTEVGTEGDSFFVVFPSAVDAVAAAARVQRDLAAHAWPDEIEVKVRIGLHTGEGVFVGDNYGGIDVHRAARIAAAAHGGQVLVSASTTALVRGSVPDGVSLRDMGKHRLKDLGEPEMLTQLVVDGLRHEFPPIKSIDSMPNNLPVELTRFIGREEEIKRISEALDAARLLTLTGPGGTGKTRLSLQVAARQLETCPGGVFFVPLAPLFDPGLVPTSIAAAIGLHEEAGRPIFETLKEHLKGMKILLVLDNFEQLIDAAPMVADLLQAATELKILVTSRIALRIAGEQEYSVPPMPLPDPEDLPDLDKVMRYESVALFVERAAAVKTGFELTEENAPAVVAICARLDGLPLAIELAAARARILTPQAIRDRLHDALGLLSSGGRDLPERQRTLRGAIDWSYRLLEPDLQAFFRRLAIFVGSFDFDAAETVCNPDGELGVDTLDAITVLVDGSLVRQFDSDGRSRFRLLQLIREFGLDCLDAAKKEELGRRHAEFYLARSEQVAPEFSKNPEALDAIELELDNIRAVFARVVERNDALVGLRLVYALWRFAQQRGHLEEARGWAASVLTLPSAVESLERTRGLLAEASIAYWQNDYEVAQKSYEEALRIARSNDDDAGAAEATYSLAYMEWIRKGDLERAKSLFDEARVHFERLGDEYMAAFAQWGAAWILQLAGENEAAETIGRRVLEQFRGWSDLWGETSALMLLSHVKRDTGDLEGSEALIRDTMALSGTIKDIGNVSAILGDFSYLELLRGRHARAVRLFAATDRLKDDYKGQAPPELTRPVDPRPAAREALGDERVEEEYRLGYDMTIDEAIAYIDKVDE